MRETVCHFGPILPGETNGSLVGILTQPDHDIEISGAPIAIILNAGIVHRVGPFRLHVDLARQLAQQGYSTLRLDLSCLGDSAPRRGKIEADQRAPQDVSDAMDFLSEQTGVEQFVLIGLCSGAYNAHQSAVKDERIIGAAFMDGIVFRTRLFYLHHYFLRFLRPRFWRNAIKRRLANQPADNDTAAGEQLGESEFFDVSELTPQGVGDELKQMFNRGMRMLFLYTDGYDDIASRAQFKEMFGLTPDEEQLQVDYFPKSEHTFRLIENRQAACERITDWFAGQFPCSSQFDRREQYGTIDADNVAATSVAATT